MCSSMRRSPFCSTVMPTSYESMASPVWACAGLVNHPDTPRAITVTTRNQIGLRRTRTVAHTRRSKSTARAIGSRPVGSIQEWEAYMADSVYTVVELIGTSTTSWEKAAAAAVKTASQSLRDLRVAEVVELDMQLDEGKITAYRAKVKVSFKYESDGSTAAAKSAPAKKAPAKRRCRRH